MIKLQTDFHLSTIIEKRGRCPGGGANILGGGFISLSVVVSLIFIKFTGKFESSTS